MSTRTKILLIIMLVIALSLIPQAIHGMYYDYKPGLLAFMTFIGTGVIGIAAVISRYCDPA